MPDPLPTFRYHPDPVATGAVVESDDECICCARARGYLYVGPVYAIDELNDEICPWCIADGLVAERFDASFAHTDPDDYLNVPDAVIEEIGLRTPSYSSWQQDYWLFHCSDGCAFLGSIGSRELRDLPADATDAVVASLRDYNWPEDRLRSFVAALDREGQPTGYLFQCLHCGAYQAHCDFT